jgi:ABC-type glycerol-3-phosphate transport system permease component
MKRFALAVAALLALGSWNDYWWPLIIATRSDM